MIGLGKGAVTATCLRTELNFPIHIAMQNFKILVRLVFLGIKYLSSQPVLFCVGVAEFQTRGSSQTTTTTATTTTATRTTTTTTTTTTATAATATATTTTTTNSALLPLTPRCFFSSSYRLTQTWVWHPGWSNHLGHQGDDGRSSVGTPRLIATPSCRGLLA